MRERALFNEIEVLKQIQQEVKDEMKEVESEGFSVANNKVSEMGGPKTTKNFRKQQLHVP